jgi:predicted HTH transcriptional regulator
LPEPEPLLALIAGGESQNVEFKASFQWDYRQQKRNKDLHAPVMKNLAGYMNTVGGTVLIGVDDEGQILGLEPDYATMGKKDSDGFENNFNMAFNQMIGAEYRHYLDVSFHTLTEKEICAVRVLPADEPVFITNKGEEKFYIRTGNSSQPLSVSKASRYIQKRFGTA